MELQLADKVIKSDLPAFVMGIVNCTPDSFYEKSRGGVSLALSLIAEGADIIDIGSESSRPGSEYVSEVEQIKRILGIVNEIRKHSNIPISIDTRSRAVMEAAWNEGADILNDISAFEDDEALAPFIAEKKLPVILMHKRGNPKEMQKNPIYKDAFKEVNEYLESRANFALKNGISDKKIIVDPGIGFGKDLEANTELIKKCGLLCAGKYPVVMALSRKDCIGEITGRAVEERLSGTLTANILAVLNGANILRVHDVKETVDSLKILKKIGSSKREEVNE